MTKRRVLWLAPALVLIGLAARAPESARKCGGALAPGGKALVAIDGVVRWGEDLSSAMPVRQDVYSVSVICLNPADSTFNRTHGWGLASIWTKAGPAPRVEKALDVIRDAQDAQFAKHGRYLGTLAEIQFPESMKPLRMTLTADQRGWTARTTVLRLLRTCTMSDGAVTAAAPITPRTAVCSDDP